MTSKELKTTMCWPRTLRYIISPIRCPVSCGDRRLITWRSYHRSYAIHHKWAKVCRPAYQKDYRLLGNLWGLVVGEDRSDYHPYLSSTVWIAWRWKIWQLTYSRDKPPACLSLTSWQTSLRTVVGRKENSEASQTFIYLCFPVLYLWRYCRTTNDAEFRDFRKRLCASIIELKSTSDKCKSIIWNLHQPPRHQLSILYLSSSNNTRLTHLQRLITLPPPDVGRGPSQASLVCTQPSIFIEYRKRFKRMKKRALTSITSTTWPPTSQIPSPILRLYTRLSRNWRECKIAAVFQRLPTILKHLGPSLSFSSCLVFANHNFRGKSR